MTAPTFLDLALLSMDVYEQNPSEGINFGKGFGQFALGLPSSRTTNFAAQEYTFDGASIIAYEGSVETGDWVFYDAPAAR
jgi:hypothetical protein